MSRVTRRLAHVRHHHHAVGQGLFCFGEFQLIHPSRESFFWVHDCGATTADQDALRREVTRAKRDLGERRTIDLLILSHFDSDHISGLRELLRDVSVDWLVLPYMLPADRILLAVAAGASGDSDFASYAYDPVAFLSEFTGNGEIRNVVFIGDPDQGDNAQGGEAPLAPEPPSDTGGPKSPRGRHRSEFLKMHWEDALLVEIDSEDDSRKPKEFRVGSAPRLLCGDLWEFLFLNKPAWRGNPLILRREVNAVLRRVRRGELPLPDAVDRIREIYRRSDQFGNKANGRNNISLLTYAGPICEPPWSQVRAHRHSCSLVPSDIEIAWPGWTVSEWSRLNFHPAALMYTGDVTLNAALRKQAQDTWNMERWRRIEFLQVPHHGAESGWKETAMREWEHSHSVFSYGTTNSHRHPRPAVITALQNHGPIFVNEFQGFTWWCLLEWRRGGTVTDD
jgi:hypothetical protein